MSGGIERRARPLIYLFAAQVGVMAAGVGFAKTFFSPLLQGTFSAPPIVYVHGVLLFGWVGLFLTQSLLIQRAQTRVHKRLGLFGVALAAGVVLSTVGVVLYASRRMAAAGDALGANSQLLIVLLDITVFALLVGFAVWYRKQPEIHRRLMILALVQALAPAWFRFRHYFPSVEHPLIWFGLLLADSLILVAALYDYRRSGRVHAVYLFVGGPLFILHCGEVTLTETASFERAAASLGRLLL
jgi:predicted membrane channel-forming protein YqfA (hemolysin III family)